MSEKRRIRVDLGSVERYRDDRSLQAFIDELMAIADGIHLDQIEVDWTDGDDYHCSKIDLEYRRDETDDERRAREQWTGRMADNERAREIAELVRLKQKYPGL